MGYTLERFSSECHRILSEDPGVEGRKKVCALVQDVLKDQDFVATHLHDGVPSGKSSTRIRSWDSAFSVMSIMVRGRASRTTTVRPGRSTARRAAKRS
jgi:hypothetical protein